jgi:callose synthase
MTDIVVLLLSVVLYGFIRTFQSGLFKRLFTRSNNGSNGYRNGYMLVPTSLPSGIENTKVNRKAPVQRTFSYPDTLEFNYFDPDNVPETMRFYADTIFLVVQSLAQQYGFQVDNSRNQAEHFLMLLSNETDETDKYVFAPALRLHIKFFSNYRKWCARMGVKPLLMKDLVVSNSFEHVVEDILVYLLIWGEAANLRHLPECLCFLFHKIMKEHVNKMYRGNGHITPKHSPKHFAGVSAYPGYFLDMIVTPIYEVVAESLQKSCDHTQKKIYDDFNEFFWSPSCLKYRLTDDLSVVSSDEILEAGGLTSQPLPLATGLAQHRNNHAQSSSAAASNYQTDQSGVGDANAGVASAMSTATKTYLEKRSWLHPLYSMRRVFEWHVITFTLLATLSFSNSLQWTYAFTFQVASFVFWEITFFSLLWTCLEVWVVFPHVNISDPTRFGFLLRLITGFLVLSYQTVYYHWSFILDPQASPSAISDFFKLGDKTFWWWQFVWLSLLSSSFYILESFLCWFPSIVSNVLMFDNDLLQALLGICYPLSQLYVGKKIHVQQKEVNLYILYWLTLIAYKLWFGYQFIVYPVTAPTLELYDDYMNFQKISFFKTSSLIFFWWFPHFLVYIIDLSIWYAVWSSLVGGFIAIIDRQGAVRENKAFRAHFMRAPLAFCQKLMPSSTDVNQRSAKQHASTASISNLLMSIKSENNEKDVHKILKPVVDISPIKTGLFKNFI